MQCPNVTRKCHDTILQTNSSSACRCTCPRQWYQYYQQQILLTPY